MSFVIAIVGRPNVGKSRLFNRLSSTVEAIVHDQEGVTRDRQYAQGSWYDKEYTIIDTGGFLPSTEEPMLVSMRRQATLAIEEADAIIFMMDGRAGLTSSDIEIAELLRSATKPVFHVVNKVDAPLRAHEYTPEFYELGADLYPLSAEHGPGLDELMTDIIEHIPERDPDEEPPPFARVAVVGKPNAGKSSLINQMLGEERLLISDVAGTTRDSIDTHIDYEDKEYLFIDTAGLRKKKKVSEELEHFAVVQAIKSIDRADVALMVIDASKGVTSQDKKIAGVIANRGRACVIVINKWDLVAKDSYTADEWREAIYREMPWMKWAPIVLCSALTGKRTHTIFARVDHVYDRFIKRVTTSKINQYLERSVAMHSPPMQSNRRVKFYYASQVATRPPAFVFMVNFPDLIPESYVRFLENRLREDFDFEGTPIRMIMRSRRRRDLS